MCHNLECIIADDYQMCCKCYLYYEKHNPKVIDDFEIGIITKEYKDIDLNLCINCSDDAVDCITIYLFIIIRLMVINLMIIKKFNIIKRCFIIENII